MTTTDDQKRERTAAVIAWTGLLIAGGVCAAAAFVVDTAILWEHSTGCEPGPADPGEVFVGRLSMAVVLVVLLGLWLLVRAALRRRHTAVVIAALLGLAPALGYAAYGWAPGAWVGGFCIPF